MSKARWIALLALLGAAPIARAQAPEVTPEGAPEPPPSTPTQAPALAVPEESFDPALMGAGAEGTLSAEELEKLGFGGGSTSVDTDLKIFGFADMNFAFLPVSKDNPWRKVVTPHGGFFIGNFNLYLSKNLSNNVRTMSEVRVHYAPHGAPDASTGGFINNAYRDVSDNDRPVKLGGIEIERIYLEWTIIPYLSVRLGQYLTPYGIWNVDHGSPVYIPPVRPYVIGSALFPERQTGAEFLGRYDAGTNDSIGYHFTLSNGMGPVTEVRDLDANKGVGGRFYWEHRALGTLKIGGSAFYAKDTTAVMTSALSTTGSIVYTERIDAQSKVLALAVDAQWRWRGLITQAEFISQQRKWVESGRIAGINPLTGVALFPMDYNTWGAYGLVGYSFNVGSLNLLPYFLVNSFDEIAANFTKTKVNGFSVGI
ncbi:MAG TPA: hypothetical protein VFX59_27030, partial [Polyangiales bacterium]|nr:hypothetical protein [Polyangiales bacterium]